MARRTGRRDADGSRRFAVARYVAGWVLGGALVALGAVALFDLLGEDAVTLPPVRETRLEEAAGAAGCELRRTIAGEVVRPPTDGVSGARPPKPGVYDKSPGLAALGSAVRHGLVVIHYRDVGAEVREALEHLQTAVPEGTIVTPDVSGMPYKVAVTSFRRLLGCGEFGRTTVDAVRLFRGRFIGSGPDRPGTGM